MVVVITKAAFCVYVCVSGRGCHGIFSCETFPWLAFHLLVSVG